MKDVYRYLLETPNPLWERLEQFIAVRNAAIAKRNQETGGKEKRLYYNHVINAAIEKYITDQEQIY